MAELHVTLNAVTALIFIIRDIKMKLDNLVTNKRIISSYDKLSSRCYSIHGTKYDYSNVIFKNMMDKVSIRCTKCEGTFYQSMSEHLRSKGCPVCSRHKVSETLSLTKFISKANRVHNNAYSYKYSVYVNSKTKLEIICTKHGSFWQIPNSHVLGSGCKQCSIENMSKPLRYSIDGIKVKANSVHNNLYSYEKAIYTGILSKIEIVCRTHGSFFQVVADHLKGRGCPSCAVHGFDSTKPAILYYLRVVTPTVILYKIGITNSTVNKRFTLIDREVITVLQQSPYEIGKDAYDEEQRILKEFKQFQYIGPDVLSSGNTELFTQNVLSII